MFDRTAHCQRIAAHGGNVTADRYGSSHMKTIARAGWDACVAKHGHGYCVGLAKAKGWQGKRRDSLGVDLALAGVARG